MSDSVKIVRNLHDSERSPQNGASRGQTIAPRPDDGRLSRRTHLARQACQKEDPTRPSSRSSSTRHSSPPNEDLSRYPRDEAGDLEKLADADADLVWIAKRRRDVSGRLFDRRSRAGSTAKDLEGAFRPHHFDGVATVCCQAFQSGVARYRDLRREGFSAADRASADGPRSRHALEINRCPNQARYRRAGAFVAQCLSVRSRAADCAGALCRDFRSWPIEVASRHADSAAASPTQAPSSWPPASRKSTMSRFATPKRSNRRQPRSGERPLRVFAACWLGKTRLIDNVAV